MVRVVAREVAVLDEAAAGVAAVEVDDFELGIVSLCGRDLGGRNACLAHFSISSLWCIVVNYGFAVGQMLCVKAVGQQQ